MGLFDDAINSDEFLESEAQYSDDLTYIISEMA